MLRYLFYALLVCLLVTCSKDKDRIIGQDDIINITFETDTSNLFADNNTVLQFKGIIPAETKEAFRSVSFSATDNLGEFQGTVKEKKNIVLADQAGIARSSIKLGTKPGTYFLSAEITADGKTYKSRDYQIRLKTLPQNNLIKLEFESDISNLRADNQSIIKLKATVPPNNTGELRTVSFFATAGLGTFKGTSASIAADQDGFARSNLEVGGTAGDYFVAAEVKIGDRTYRTADIPVHLNAVPASEKISITVNNSSPPADGYSLVHISVSTHFTKDKSVVLAASAGTFIQSGTPTGITLGLNQQGTAETDLRISSELKPHIISATITETPPATVTVLPVISYPEIVLVEPSAQRVEFNGAGITVRVYLRKTLPERMVTKGIPVTFRAYQLVNNQQVAVGRFTGLATAASTIDGSVPAVTFIADGPGIDKNLPVILEVSAPRSSTDNIIETKSLTVF